MRPRRPAAAVLAATLTVVGCGAAASCGAAAPPKAAPPASAPAPTSTTAAVTTVPPDLPPPGDGALPQTVAVPPTSGPTVDALGRALLASITGGQPAAGVFFPEAAYLQVKAVADPSADFTGRLVGHFDLDLAAARQAVGPDAAFVALELPSPARWVAPGSCANRVGYWHVGEGRLVFTSGGVERSIGVASLISWRGWWYVVHLGAVLPPADRGVVDRPLTGAGRAGPTTGC